MPNGLPRRATEPQEQQTGVRSRPKSPNIGEIEILGDEEPRLLLRSPPDIRIDAASKPFGRHRIHIVTESGKFPYQSGR